MSDAQSAQSKGQQIKEIMKTVQEWVAEKSFDGARNFLQSSYCTKILNADHIKNCRQKVDNSQEEYKKHGKRLYWQWWVIFFIVSMIAAVAIFKYGVIESLMEYFGFVASNAQLIIGGIVTTITGFVSCCFAYLGNQVDKLINCLRNKM